MNTSFPTFVSTPAGSLLKRQESQRSLYIQHLVNMPASLQDAMASPKTGAFIIGLVKSHGLEQKFTSDVAFAILRIFTGEKTLAELPGILSSELQIANDKAQAIAKEIEKELIAPIAKDLNEYLASKKQQPPQPSAKQGSAGMKNVLDLNTGPKPPRPYAPPSGQHS